MPPAPPCTSRVSPGWRPATMNTLDQTVQATSGMAAGGLEVRPRAAAASPGRRARPPSRRTRPPARSAQTSSPTLQPSTPSPTALIRPEHSRPSTSEAPSRRRVEALALQGVGAVDRAGDDVDDDLAGTRLGVGQLGDGQGLGPTRLGCGDGAHAATLGDRWTRKVRRRPRRRSTSTSTSSTSSSSSSGDLSQRSASGGGEPGQPLDLLRVHRRTRQRRTRAGTW